MKEVHPRLLHTYALNHADAGADADASCLMPWVILSTEDDWIHMLLYLCHSLWYQLAGAWAWFIAEGPSSLHVVGY